MEFPILMRAAILMTCQSLLIILAAGRFRTGWTLIDSQSSVITAELGMCIFELNLHLLTRYHSNLYYDFCYFGLNKTKENS